MRVRLVCYEDLDLWILGKFARKLNEELRALSIDSDIAKVPDPDADINHHIIYWYYDGVKSSIDTVMITHIDTFDKLKQLKGQLEATEMGICMSRQTMDQLSASGVPRDRLCFINPAHDNLIRPRKIVVGITSKVHADGRKRENSLIEIARHIRPDQFMFKIMGSGWDAIVETLREMGFSVEYHDRFDYDSYVSLVPTFDYYLYLSFDEGSMGFIDALAAGVKTIVTPQGYHLDVPGGITYPVRNQEDVIAAFEKIAEEQQKLVGAVSEWTWADYAEKHIEIWQYPMNGRDSRYVLEQGSRYRDGLCTVRHENTAPVALVDKLRARKDFILNSHSWFNLVNRWKARIGSLFHSSGASGNG